MIRPLLSISNAAPPTQPLVLEEPFEAAPQETAQCVAGEIQGNVVPGWLYCATCDVSVANATKLNVVSVTSRHWHSHNLYVDLLTLIM